MTIFSSFSGWKFAWGIAWILILGLICITVAEMSQYGGIVQFYGDSLIFAWEGEGSQNHYRVHLTKQIMCDPQSADVCSTLYSFEPSVQVETAPGCAYSMRVQAVTVLGNASELSTESPNYLCLGNTGQGGMSGLVFLPSETALGPSYPNPFNAATTIPYTIASKSGSAVAVSLIMYNTLGQVVKKLVDEDRMPGQYRAIWDGRNEYGTIVSAGTYICLLKTGEFSGTRTIIFLK